MRKMVHAIVAIIIVITTGQLCLGQEIRQEADGLYSTRKLLSTAQMSMGNSITIKSASALRGKLTITTSDTKEISLTYYKKAKTNSPNNQNRVPIW